jgi:hypothetical protein
VYLSGADWQPICGGTQKQVVTKISDPDGARKAAILVNRDVMLQRNGEILYAPAGPDSAVMMSIEAGRYYGLNAMATRVWELLEKPKTVAELGAILCEEYEVDAQACEADIQRFVDELLANGIVRVPSE